MHFICYSVEPMVGRTAYFGVPEGVRLSFFSCEKPCPSLLLTAARVLALPT